ncbi:MAG: uncharacterized protein K0S67_227 [Nitrososphaeraceae archaeon]|nr:uncharacterized protein [Nitrososphaeraceae archaeon]
MNRISALYAIAIATLTTAVVITGALLVSYEENQVMAYSRAYGKGNFTFGTISSIQNDESGNPAWVVSGHWKGNLLSNQSNVTSQGNISSSSGPTFNASVEMIMLNGTAAHTHTITNFVLANTSMPNNMTRIFNGTSTASMREGPVTDIPTGISIMGDKVISIWLDPSKINNQMESNIWSK